MTSVTNSCAELDALSWTEFDARRANMRIAVIPCGAVDVYGPHLPLGSDSFVAEGVVSRVAEKLSALRTPLIPVGYSTDLMTFPGTLCVEPEAFKAYLYGVCRTLIRWGLDRLLFLNTHLGNVTLIDEAANIMVEEGSALCMQIDWWRFAARVGGDLLTTPWAAGHAGELGTSVLLYLAGQQVYMEAAQGFVPPSNPWPAGLTLYDSYRDVTPTGVLGVASAGTAAKGEQIVSRCVEAIVQETRRYFG